MDWGKWFDKLLQESAIAGIPVLVAALSVLQKEPSLPLWAAPVVAALLVGLKLLGNWLKNRNRPTAGGVAALSR